MAAGPTAVASHRTAGRAPPAHARHAAAASRSPSRARARARGRGLTIHRTTRPPTITTVRGLPVTAPLRTLADLAPDMSAEAFEALCAEALVRRLVTARDLDALAPDAAPTRSELERRFRRLVRDAGLPPPEVNRAARRDAARLPLARRARDRRDRRLGRASGPGRVRARPRARRRPHRRRMGRAAVHRAAGRRRAPAWVVARLAATLSTSGRARSAPAGAPRG